MIGIRLFRAGQFHAVAQNQKRTGGAVEGGRRQEGRVSPPECTDRRNRNTCRGVNPPVPLRPPGPAAGADTPGRRDGLAGGI